MKCRSCQKGHYGKVQYFSMSEFCLAQKVSHDDGKRRVCRDGCKHAHDAGSNAILIHINHIFQSGKTHTYHNCVYDAIVGLIEILIIEEDESYKKELAELFDKSNFEKSVYKLMNVVVSFRENYCVYGKAY